MPILDLQRRLRELGRIRTGEKVSGSNGSRPAKLDRFRLTSSSKDLIEAAAAQYGSDRRGVRPWTNPFDSGQEYEVVVSAETLPILVPPGQSLSQWWELYSGAGCQRRCDGVRETLQDRPCVCPAAGKERADMAGKGQACKPTTRLSVMLPELGDVGVWRLESHGYYAAVELAGMAELLERATRSGRLLKALLRLDQRTVKRPGQATRNFAVPVIELPPGSAGLALELADGEPPQIPGETVPPQLPGPPALPAETGIKPATEPAEAETIEVVETTPNAVPKQEAKQPACRHPKKKHTATEQGVVCGECGELLAERAPAAPEPERPKRRTRATSRRASKKPGDEGYWSDRVHAAAAEKGIDHDGLRLIAAAVIGEDPAALALPDGDENRFSVKSLVDEAWEEVDGVIRDLSTSGDEDSDLDAISAWLWPYANAKALDSWEAINVLAGAATGHADADELTVAEWVAWTIRLRAGEYDAARTPVAVGA